MRQRRGAQVIGLFFLILPLCLCLGSTALTRIVAPDGDQYRIAGFAIGEGYERILIPRSALTCTNPNGVRHQERCQLTIAGRDLVAEITHDDHTLNYPSCLVRYGDREGACWDSNYNVGGPTYAAMSRVGLGLAEADVASVANRQPLRSWREANWVRAGNIVVLIVAACLALTTLFLLPLRLPLRAVSAFCIGGLAWGFGWFAAWIILLSANLIG